MDPTELRRLMRSSGVDLWTLIDSSIALAVGEHAAELRARRDGIVQRLYASPAPAAGQCRSCRCRRRPVSSSRDGEEEEEQEDGEEPVRKATLSPESMNGDEDELTKVLAIKDLLEDPDQTEESLVRLLQNLADMEITFKVLQESDIGRDVNGFRKHQSGEVRRLAKLLVRKWKDLVDDWVKSNSDAASPAFITEGDSPQQMVGKNHHNGHQVPEFGHSPNPNNGYLSSERNGAEPVEPKAKAVNAAAAAVAPPPRREAQAPSKPMNNNHSNQSNPISATQTNGKGSKDSLLDPERFASARKRLQENYQEAQNAKKQRTIQVMDIHEIPKPKNPARRGGGGGGGGFHAKHW